MTDQRWRDLMSDEQERLTKAEISENWHFCPEFDGLLIGPGMWQFDECCPWERLSVQEGDI